MRLNRQPIFSHHFFSAIWYKIFNRPADENHPYGHGRAEPLITFIVVGFLISSAVIIAYESISNIQTPHQLPKPWTWC
jgi:divalent metal cation (Fe/Co/Zn/Cd) transporter